MIKAVNKIATSQNIGIVSLVMSLIIFIINIIIIAMLYQSLWFW